MVWFRNVAAYPLKAGVDVNQIDERLAQRAFVPMGSSDEHSLGWVPPASHMPDLFCVACQGAYLVAMRSDEKSVPASLVNQAAIERIAALEKKEDRKLGRREKKEIKEAIREELLPKVLPKSRVTHALIDVKEGVVWVNASNCSTAEGVLSFLRDTLGSLPTRLLSTRTSPQTAMTLWVEKGAPEGFELDTNCAMVFPGEKGASAKFNNQALDAEEVQKSLVAGKLVTQLGLIHEQRLSFQLTEGLLLKRMTMLDILQEQIEEANAEDAAALFDVELSLLVGELRELYKALVGALGGEDAK